MPKLVAVEIIAMSPNLIKSSGREAAEETNKFLEIKVLLALVSLVMNTILKQNCF